MTSIQTPIRWTVLFFLFLYSEISLANDFGAKLAEEAERRIGVTVTYDPSYVSLAFPGGDVPRDRGVCTDVLIRALRDAHQIDLQKKVNQDMKQAFSSYPKTWGLSATDPSIDHRRVFNLEHFFHRKGFSLPVTEEANNYLPGDIVTWMLPGNLPHLGIVSTETSFWSRRPMIIHNIGAETELEDRLFDFQIRGHYRIKAAF